MKNIESLSGGESWFLPSMSSVRTQKRFLASELQQHTFPCGRCSARYSVHKNEWLRRKPLTEAVLWDRRSNEPQRVGDKDLGLGLEPERGPDVWRALLSEYNPYAIVLRFFCCCHCLCSYVKSSSSNDHFLLHITCSMSGRNTVCSHELIAEFIKRHQVLSDHSAQPEKRSHQIWDFNATLTLPGLKLVF